MNNLMGFPRSTALDRRLKKGGYGYGGPVACTYGRNVYNTWDSALELLAFTCWKLKLMAPVVLGSMYGMSTLVYLSYSLLSKISPLITCNEGWVMSRGMTGRVAWKLRAQWLGLGISLSRIYCVIVMMIGTFLFIYVVPFRYFST